MPFSVEGEIERLRTVFRTPHSDSGPPESAVLLPLVPSEGRLHLLLTLRAAALSQHPGEFSFPGGRVEAGDADALEAALRETEEEVGLGRATIDVLGPLETFRTFRSTLLTSFVGVVRADGPVLRLNDEVEAAALVPVESLLRPGLPAANASARTSALAPVRLALSHESREFAGADGPERVIHYWRLNDGRTLWGITGHLVARFLQRGFDWRPAAAPRPIRSRDDVMP